MLTLKAWWLLFAYDLFFVARSVKPLRPWHFRAVRSTVRKWKVRACAASDEEITRVCHAMDLACVLYFKHVQCVQKAVVSTYLLRKRGHPAEMVLGAQTIPYKAHAWLEVRGKVINERRDVRRIFQVWDRC